MAIDKREKTFGRGTGASPADVPGAIAKRGFVFEGDNRWMS
jgi:hypothetical protein